MLKRFAFVLVLIAGAAPAFAQSHLAAIRGAIVDPSGALVPGVTVRVTNVETGELRSTTTDDGRFVLSALQPGQYRVQVEKQGFAPIDGQIELQVNQQRSLDFTLTVGAVTRQVDVISSTEPVQRESAALSTVIEGRQVTGLPLDGRNYLELALLAPGTAPAPQGSASSLRGDFALIANGAREDLQTFLLDGVYNVDPKLNTPGVQLPVDAIREFEVLTNGYDASFGRNAGGQISVVTQSGTNALHGSAYGFFRTRALNARNVFAPADEEAPAYNRQQGGGSIGGPLVRNRTFFFADYEHTRLREGMTRITNVPTDAERNGDFSQSLLPAPFDAFSRATLSESHNPIFLYQSDRTKHRGPVSPPKPIDANGQFRFLADSYG